jgi:hypothetical protein
MRTSTQHCLIFILLLLLLPVGRAVALAPNDFRYQAPLTGGVIPTSVCMVTLPAEVLQKAVALDDFRLFGPDRQEVPFVLHSAEAEQAEQYQMKILAYDDMDTSALLTVELPAKHQSINEIELATDARDFRTTVTVTGSQDRRQWRQLAREAIFDFSAQVDLRKTRISLPSNSYRYLRLLMVADKKLKPGADALQLYYKGVDLSVGTGKPRIIRISGIVGRSAPVQAELFDRLTIATPPVTVDKGGNSVLTLATGVPVDRISLDLADSYFHRRVTILASDTGKEESYRQLCQGSLYRFLLGGSSERREAIYCRAEKPRFLRIIIDNGSNRPLAIRAVTIEWRPRTLSFVSADVQGSYLLVFGNGTLARPNYDLSRFDSREMLQQSAMQSVTVGPVRENPTFRPPPDKNRRAKTEKTLLIGVVSLLTAGMGYWLYRLMAKVGGR